MKTIDKHLLELKNDSQSLYYESLKRWTTEKTVFKLPAWMKTLALIAGLALLISLVAGVLLKVQVNARTRELRQINQEMEQRIKLRTAELANAMEKAQDADRIKSAFLATMSHELRTPLNSIIGFTGIILQGIVGPLNDEQKKQLNMVRGSAQHLLSLINDVLDLSKIEAGQLQIAYESFDFRSTIVKAVESARPLAGKKGLELTCAVSPEIETINSDRRRVEQILLNLISNAIKFTEKGSVKIECEPEGDNVTIRVVDTGIGIKTEDLETLFQAFRQIDSGMTRKYEGTGLGLSISKRLVELMGGQIRVTSMWGDGKHVQFFPAEREERCMKGKVLVIEDNEQNLYLVRFILEQSNYEVFAALDGKAGIEMAASLKPDLILLDIQLPVMDGYAVARNLRRNPELADTPIVAVTSYAMTGDREKVMEAGCNGYIEKPIDPDTFVAKVEKHLSIRLTGER